MDGTSAFGVEHSYEEISKVSLGGVLKPLKAGVTSARNFGQGFKGSVLNSKPPGGPQPKSFFAGSNLGSATRRFGSGVRQRTRNLGADTAQRTTRAGATNVGAKMQARPLATGAGVMGVGAAGVGGGGYAMGRKKNTP